MKRRTASVEMERSWLVQRLTRRHDDRFSDVANAFSFGGGLRNGGLSSEAMKLLPFRFDYMGAAEFEWGAVPKALNTIAAQKDLTARHIEVHDRPVYVLCRNQWADEVEGRIREWASAPWVSGLKESTRLHDAIVKPDEWSPIGWLELDNGFLFFTDDAVFRATCGLFGVAS